MRQLIKLVIVACVAALVTLAIAGCGNQAKPGQETGKQPAGSQQAEASKDAAKDVAKETAKTRKITDVLGRTVEIPTKIEKVDCQGSSARMMVYAGAADKIAGLTELEMCKDADIATLAAGPHAYTHHEQFLKCVATSSGWPKFETYYEQIVSLDPDVIVFFGADAAACDKMQEKVGIPVVGIYAKDLLSPDFKQTLLLLGDIMGTKEHAEKVVAGLDGYLKDLKDRSSKVPEDKRPSVYAAAISFKGYNGFDGTYGKFPIFEAIGAKNVVDETGKAGSMFVDLEKLAVWNPDYIFINDEPQSLAIVNEKYKADPAFYDSLSAVKNKRLYTMAPFNWYNTNMEIALVDAYWVAKNIYPEQFADVDFDKKANEIFNLFVGQDYLDVLNKAGLGFTTYTLGK